MSALATQPIFNAPRMLSQSEVKAAAVDMQGAVVNQDFVSIIGDYQRSEGTLWQLLPAANKRYATSARIQQVNHRKYPKIGAVDRDNLEAVAVGIRNTQQDLARDFSDPGQDIKCIYGDVDSSYFIRSLQQQQGNIWEDTFASNSDNLLSAAIRYREQKMFTGNASLNPLEFNGLANLMYQPPDGEDNPNQTYVDLTGDGPLPQIHKELIRICIGTSTEPNENHRMSHIFCSGTAQWKMIDEVQDLNIYENRSEISPGIVVPSVIVPNARNNQIPLVQTSYLPDEHDVPDPEDDSRNVDLVHFYIVDLTTILWYGVVPYDGINSLDFQVFDLSNRGIDNVSLLMRRFVLQFGCLYAANGGRGIHRLTLKLPVGEAFSRRTTAIQL